MIQVDVGGTSNQDFQYNQPLPLENNEVFHGLGSEDDDEAYPQLPPPQFIEAIVSLYFSHVHPWIPMLNQDRFRNRLRHPAEIQRIDVILHAMYVSVHRYLPGSMGESVPSIEYPGWSITSLRRWVVTTAMDNLSIHGLQALIIIAFDDVSFSHPPSLLFIADTPKIGSGNASKAWSIIASLTRTVEYCQLTTEHEKSHRQPICRPFSYLDPPRDWTDQEERRRVFWNIFILDRFCSISMGWSISLTSMDVRRRLPSDGILWRKQEPVVTPFLGVWDKSTSSSGNGTGIAGRPQSPGGEVSCDTAIENDHRQGQSTGAYPHRTASSEVDMSKVGQFAYCVEATESMSRVTNYFLQQKFDPNNPREVEWWLTRFKELDLRLAHWKMLLPQKWKSSSSSSTTAAAPRQGATKLDPNLTLAHVTHNASTILLHQLIAYPPPSWPFRRRLPSAWSAETCCSAGAEICTITQQYLRGSGADSTPVTSQYAFCVYIAARMMLLHWRHASPGGGELHSDFWPLVNCLEEMAKRWKGSRASEPAKGQVLADKYASKLRELWQRCSQDETFRIDVTGYTREIEHRQRTVSRRGLGSTPSSSPSWTRGMPPRQWTQDVADMTPYGMMEGAAAIAASPATHSLRRDSTSYGMMAGPQTDQFGFGMNLEGSMSIDSDYFMNLDRVITFGDGGLFTSNNMDGGSW